MSSKDSSDDIDAELESLNVEELGEKAEKSYTWEIIITIVVLIFLVLTGIFLYLWITVYLQNQAIIRNTNACNQSIDDAKTQTDTNNQSIAECEQDNETATKTSIGIYQIDTRKFISNGKTFLEVDVPNQPNYTEWGVYPITTVKTEDQRGDYNFIDGGQYPKTSDIHKIEQLYSFSIKPKTVTNITTDNCPYWEVINRLKTGWSWELGYNVSKDKPVYYKLPISNQYTNGNTEQIANGGITVNSGNITEGSTGRCSCIGMSAMTYITIYDPQGNSTQYQFSPPQQNFVVIIFHDSTDDNTINITLGSLALAI